MSSGTSLSNRDKVRASYEPYYLALSLPLLKQNIDNSIYYISKKQLSPISLYSLPSNIEIKPTE